MTKENKMKTYRVISSKRLISDIEVQAQSPQEAEQIVGQMTDEQMAWEDDDFEISDCYEQEDN